MCDDVARMLAMVALDAAQGGSGRRGIDNVYIKDGHLHIVFSDGLDSDVGEVVGQNRKIYVPKIDDHKILSWSVEDIEGAIPDPVDLNPFDEWSPIGPEEGSAYVWEPIVENDEETENTEGEDK